MTMITSSSKIENSRREIVLDGIKVIYLKEPYSQEMSIFRRFRAFLGFVLKSIIEVWKQENVGLIIATSTPLSVGMVALFFKRLKNIPYVFEVRDLWPEVPIQMGVFKSSLVKRVIRWFERTIYKNAEHVVALSPGMQDGVIKYIPREKTSMIPNMSKIEEFWMREKNIALMEQLKLRLDSFKIIHFGSIGLANGVHTIIESAQLLKDDNSIEFLFVGGGAMEKYFFEYCERLHLTNVKFLGKFSMRDLSEIVNLSDISIVSFKDLPILYTNSPNKFFDSLSAGKPIIVNSAGWTKDIVENNRCGYYVNPNNPSDLVKRILYLKQNPDLVLQMGRNSRRLAETVYDRSILCAQFGDLVVKVFNA